MYFTYQYKKDENFRSLGSGSATLVSDLISKSCGAGTRIFERNVEGTIAA
jgi:hypothetical protein